MNGSRNQSSVPSAGAGFALWRPKAACLRLPISISERSVNGGPYFTIAECGAGTVKTASLA
jgi:hypothetical protein